MTKPSFRGGSMPRAAVAQLLANPVPLRPECIGLTHVLAEFVEHLVFEPAVKHVITRGNPLDGLAEVLHGWSGRGQLYEALATVEDDLTEVRWQRRDIERRARRILFAQLESDIERWPTSAADWLHALPSPEDDHDDPRTRQRNRKCQRAPLESN
jgi:hypothetical protein